MEKRSKDDILLEKFNRRDSKAYSDVYLLFYDPLFLFTNRMYQGTEVDANDVIHDIFINIWERKDLKFNSFDHIKGYIYLSVRNKFKAYISHRKHVDKFATATAVDEEQSVSYMIESETISILNSAIGILPTECAKVLKLFIDGWEIKDIAEKLGKSQSTVYNQKNEAISILKKKFSSNKMFLIISLLS